MGDRIENQRFALRVDLLRLENINEKSRNQSREHPFSDPAVALDNGSEARRLESARLLAQYEKGS